MIQDEHIAKGREYWATDKEPMGCMAFAKQNLGVPRIFSNTLGLNFRIKTGGLPIFEACMRFCILFCGEVRFLDVMKNAEVKVEVRPFPKEQYKDLRLKVQGT